MEAHRLKEALIRLLSDNADGRYIVMNPQLRKADAESVLKKPHITVYYSSGDFDKSKSSVNSPYHHNCTFTIEILTASTAKVNLLVLQNPNSTPEQYAAALAESQNSSVIADEKTDGLISLLFDIIMRPASRNLGADYVANRWITQIKKYNPETLGSIVTQAASITLTAQCMEEVTGEEGTPGGSVDTMKAGKE
jgi:hypothetical protein